MDVTFVPIYGTLCIACESTPVVGMVEELGIRSMQLCGPCFFQDKTMVDIDRWNEVIETTE